MTENGRLETIQEAAPLAMTDIIVPGNLSWPVAPHIAVRRP